MSREAVGVRFDPRRGHVSIYGEQGPALVTMVETGDHLEFWSHEGAHMSPTVAQELADALLAWVGRRGMLAA